VLQTCELIEDECNASNTSRAIPLPSIVNTAIAFERSADRINCTETDYQYAGTPNGCALPSATNGSVTAGNATPELGCALPSVGCALPSVAAYLD
jgi:hypothetical protein